MTLLRRVVSACERFEDGWKGDKRPSLESCLDSVSDADRSRLLHELLALELELRRKAGEQPEPAEYFARFPHDIPVIQSAFACRSRGVDTNLLNLSTPPLAGPICTPVAGKLPIDESIGGYKILAKIGSGGMGVVYRAEQTSAGKRLVALKCIRPDFLEALRPAARAEAIARFRTEVEAISKLDHPNLVPVFEVGEVDGCPYFSMKYLEGGTLADRLAAGPLSNPDAAALMEKVARAVHHANERMILHRDVKPGNILFNRVGKPYVADFGLAKQLEPLQMQATPSRAELGTPAYMSPEQARGTEAIDARTDVYGLGATLYHALTGRPPFEAGFVAETLRQVLDEEPVPPRFLNPSVNRDLETICLKCLEKSPARRYATAEALADELQRVQAGEPIAARPPGLGRRLARWGRRNANRIGFAAAGVVVVTSMVVGFLPRRQVAPVSDPRFSVAPSDIPYVQRLRDINEHIAHGDSDIAWTFLMPPTLNLEPQDPRSFEAYYLWHLFSRDRLILANGRRGSGKELCVTRNGQFVVSFDFDNHVRKWDVAGGRLISDKALPIQRGPSGTFTADGRYIPLIDDEGGKRKIAIWDVEADPPKRVETGVELLGYGASISGDGRRIAYACKPHGDKDDLYEVRVCETDQSTVHCIFAGDAVSSWAISPDGNSLAVARRGEQNGAKQFGIIIFDLRNIEQPRATPFIPVQSPFITAMRFSRDSQSLFAGDPGGSVYRIALSPPHVLHQARVADGPVDQLAVSPDGRTLTVCSVKPAANNKSDYWLSVIDAETCQRRRSWKTGHAVHAIAYSSDYRAVITGSEDGLRYTPLENISDVTICKDSDRSEAWSVAYSPSGDALLVAGEEHWLGILDPLSGQVLERIKGHEAMVSCVAWSPDGEFFVSGGFERAEGKLSKNIRIWNRDGSRRAVLDGQDTSLYCVAVSNDGTTIASGGKGGQICLWDLKTGARKSLKQHADNVHEVMFLNDEHSLISVSDDGQICLWNWRDGSLLDSFSDHYRLLAAARSKDNNRFATGNDSGIVRLWRVEKDRLVQMHSLSGPASIRAMCFTPDGKSLAISGDDKKIRFWQVSSGLELFAISDLPHYVHRLSFSFDGQRLAAALHNGEVRIYYAPKVAKPSPFLP